MQNNLTPEIFQTFFKKNESKYTLRLRLDASFFAVWN